LEGSVSAQRVRRFEFLSTRRAMKARIDYYRLGPTTTTSRPRVLGCKPSLHNVCLIPFPKATLLLSRMTSSSTEPHDGEAILQVPVIDLSSNASNTNDDGLVEQIASACRGYGFFHVVNHGMDPQLVQDYIHQCELYFDLPKDVKYQWKRNESNARGYFDDELTKQRRDWKEALDFGVPQTRNWSLDDDDDDGKKDDQHVDNHCMDGWNQFPSAEVLPDFRRVVTTYFDECAKLSHRLTVLMALGLGQDETSPMVQDLLHGHSSYLRANYYPPYSGGGSIISSSSNSNFDTGTTTTTHERSYPIGSGDENNQNENPNSILPQQEEPPLGISPHKDAGFLTVLWQDENCHSLQVWKDGQWITATPVPNSFTINTGDMAQGMCIYNS
jgi:isopenicillin N synthase-like dioxygenase